MKIGVVFGGPSPEHDISVLTGLQAARALDGGGASVVGLYWAKNGSWHQVPSTLEAADFLEPTIRDAQPLELIHGSGFVEIKRFRPAQIDLDVVLNCCHGGPGEDGTLAALLRLCGLRVSGPRPQASALAMDKLATAAVAAGAGIPVIQTVIAAECESLSTPWVVKPRFGGSSIGIETGVQDRATVLALQAAGAGRGGVIVQPFLDGWIDLNVSVRTFPERQVSTIEKPVRAGSAIYTYADKYLVGGQGMDAAPRELPAVIPDAISSRMVEYANRVVDVMDLTGAPRIDFLWDGAEQLVLCEVNSIPGAWGNHLWQAASVPRAKLYRDLIDEALGEPAMLPQWAPTSDGRALRASGSIAGKLT